MQLPGYRTDDLVQPVFNRRMNILVGQPQLKGAVGELFEHLA